MVLYQFVSWAAGVQTSIITWFADPDVMDQTSPPDKTKYSAKTDGSPTAILDLTWLSPLTLVVEATSPEPVTSVEVSLDTLDPATRTVEGLPAQPPQTVIDTTV